MQQVWTQGHKLQNLWREYFSKKQRYGFRSNSMFFIIMVIFQKTVRGRGILKCGEEKHTSSQRVDNQMPKQANEQVSYLLNKKDFFFT